MQKHDKMSQPADVEALGLNVIRENTHLTHLRVSEACEGSLSGEVTAYHKMTEHTHIYPHIGTIQKHRKIHTQIFQHRGLDTPQQWWNERKLDVCPLKHTHAHINAHTHDEPS